MSNRKPVTLHRLREMHAAGEKIAMLTCYDAAFARALDEAGVDALLVGDSLGMVMQGRIDTLPVSMEDMAYHTALRGARQSQRLDHRRPALRHLSRVGRAGDPQCRAAHAGGRAHGQARGRRLDRAQRALLVERGMPVCAHLGFTPQSVHALGGYRMQGRDEAAAGTLRRHAEELADAGAAMLVLELMPAALARELTAALSIPAIGIGAGAGCSGQVLVLHDMLGIDARQAAAVRAQFPRAAAPASERAVRMYVSDVKSGRFPDDALHGF